MDVEQKRLLPISTHALTTTTTTTTHACTLILARATTSTHPHRPVASFFARLKIKGFVLSIVLFFVFRFSWPTRLLRPEKNGTQDDARVLVIVN